MTKKKWCTTALLGLVVAGHAWSLLRFPFPFVDEAWAASRAWAFVQTNRQFGTLDTGVFDRYEGYWTALPWLPTAIQSLALRLVPEPDLLPLRCISLLFGFGLLTAVYWIARSLYSRGVALLGVLLLALSWPFLYSAHLARYDILAAALGFAAIALYFNNPFHRFLPGLLSGLCLGAAFETHAHAAVYVPALAALYFFDLRWTLFRKRHFWGVMVGGLLGLLFYVALHLLPYPQTYAAINRIAFTTTHVPPILTLDVGVLVQAVRELGRAIWLSHQAMSVVLILAALFLHRRHSKADQRLLVLNGVLLLGALLLIRNKILYYVILFSPAIPLMIAAFLPPFLRQRWQGRVRTSLGYALVLGCLLGTVLANLFLLRHDMYRPYQVAQARINQTIHPEDTILAAQTYWFGLYDHVYYSWEELIYFQRYAPDSTLEDAFREFRPTVLIIDGHMRGFISDDPDGSSIYAEHLNLPETEMKAFLARYSELADEFEVDYYGLIQVYRLHWEQTEESQGCSLPAQQPALWHTDARRAFGH